MHQFIRKGQLLASAHAYLRDADNKTNSTHTRYSSAMNAPGGLPPSRWHRQRRRLEAGPGMGSHAL